MFDQVTNRMFLSLWFIAIPTAMAVVAVYALNQEFLSVKQEVKNGLYAPVSYLMANFIIQVDSCLCCIWRAYTTVIRLFTCSL